LDWAIFRQGWFNADVECEHCLADMRVSVAFSSIGLPAHSALSGALVLEYLECDQYVPSLSAVFLVPILVLQMSVPFSSRSVN